MREGRSRGQAVRKAKEEMRRREKGEITGEGRGGEIGKRERGK